MYDFALIGAGVVGGMIAHTLAQYDVTLCILERENDVAMGATRANSAIVHAGYDAHEGTLKAKLNVRGSEMMEQVARDLGVKYDRCGSLVVGFSEEDRKTLRALLDRGTRNGVRDLSLLDREQLLRIEPNVGDDVTCALFAPTGAIVCPYELCIAAVGCAMDNGAALFLNYNVDRIDQTDAGYRICAEDGRSVDARIVINCAGVHSDEIAALATDASFRVHPRRGEYMLLDKTCGNTVSHTVFRCPSPMGKGVLVTPTVDGNLLIGPTAEDIEDKTDLSTTADGLARIRAMAGAQVRGIDFSKVITSFTGLRSVGSTGDFIIDMPNEHFVNVAAIESPGLSSSPAIAEYVVSLLEQNGVALTKKQNAVRTRPPMHRFRTMSIEEKNEVIRRDPTYAHVICRCESVTEGEILAAIRQNPKPRDIDGIKRRTRATMGRCQGGFCTPYLVELLAAELGCDYGEITKFGKSSLLNVGKTKNTP